MRSAVFRLLSCSRVLYVGLLLAHHTLQSLSPDKTSQCTLLVDSLTGGEFEYLYKDGLAVSLEHSGRLPLDCVPEEADYDPDTRCVWSENGKEFGVGGNQHTYSRYPCALVARVSPSIEVLALGKNYLNLSCLSHNDRTGHQTSMTYILYFLAMTKATGYNPTIQPEMEAKQVASGYTTNITCKAYLESRTSSVITLNWYLLTEDGDRLDVAKLAKHNVTLCTKWSTEKAVELTMIISDITENLFGNHYECVVRKVDVMSAFNQTISSKKYRYHSIEIPHTTDNLQRALLKPEFTAMENLSFFDNSSKGVCTQLHPCTASFTFKLIGPDEIVNSYEMYVALGVVGGLVIVVGVFMTYVCIQRVPLRNKIKHKWAITKDIEDEDYKYHVVIFYSDNNEEEEMFVQGKLLVELENRWKYNTFVPQRDFLIGANKAEQCIEGLASSQKVIFLMTHALFSQEWNIYALDVALKEHRKIIILKWEDVDFQELLDTHGKKFGDVESALKVSTVIDWKKEKHKWQRLHLEMPAIVDNSLKHRCTYWLRQCFKVNS